VANFDIDEVVMPLKQYSMPQFLDYLEDSNANLKSFMMEQAVFPAWRRKHRNKLNEFTIKLKFPKSILFRELELLMDESKTIGCM